MGKGDSGIKTATVEDVYKAGLAFFIPIYAPNLVTIAAYPHMSFVTREKLLITILPVQTPYYQKRD